jgi:hypothetical protein
MLCPSSGGTPPPTSPVLPPCGTIGSPTSAQIRTTAATSAVEAGRTTSPGGGAAVEPSRLDEIGFLLAGIGDPSPMPWQCESGSRAGLNGG